jgi:hypothetical protein
MKIHGKTLYDSCVAAGLEMDHHESDLYLYDCPEAREILGQYNQKFEEFIDNIDGEDWLDVPFMYQPFWDAKTKVGNLILENKG